MGGSTTHDWGFSKMRPFRRIQAAALAALLATSLVPAVALAAPTAAAPASTPAAGTAAKGTETFPGNDGKAHAVTWDASSFKVDGNRLNVWSGEIHYWRLPSPDHWRDLLQKVRANGFNAVSFYFFWGMHSNAPGQYDFTGIRDIDRLFQIAKEEGLYVIARPGPYVNAEISMGGLPAYMTNTPDGLRTTNATNMAASKEWLHAFNQIAKKYQVTDGGGSMVMYQVENEMLSESSGRAAFIAELVKQVKADGITVPLFHNDYNMGFRYVPKASGGSGAGADIGLDFYAYDSYPMGFTCSASRGTISDTEATFLGRVKDNPKFISEAQGGAFTPWGAAFNPDLCDSFIDGNFMRQWGVNNIGSGVNAFNYYMSFGGTNWGYTGSPSSGFTSYDYGAAITEDRALRSKFAVQKSIGYLLDTVHQITNMKRVQAPTLTTNGSSVLALSRQATEKLDTESVTGYGSRYIGLRHDNSNQTGTTTISFPLTLGAAQDIVAKTYTNDDRDTSAITYTGSWGQSPAGVAWAIGNYRDTETYSDKAGDSLTYAFNGTGIQVIMPESLNHGYGDVYIDDVLVGQTNTYKLQNANKQVVAFVKDDLPLGDHVLKIVVTGKKDAASQGTFVSLDALNVLKPATGAADTVTRTNDNASSVTYSSSPGWTYETGKAWTEGAFNKDQHVTTNAGAEASFTFTGTGIDVISPKSNNHGPADVLIDGTKVGEMNTCIASMDYVTEQQTVAFSKKDLTNGQHTITIRARGEVGCPTGNVEAGKFVVVDAFDVHAPGTGTVEPPANTVTFPRVPAKADTFLTLHGRDAMGVVADLKLGAQDIYYSTSEPVAFESLAAGDLLVLNGYKGDAGEIVLKYDAQPTVAVSGAAVEQTWDADRKALRLNYTNGQASNVTITAAGKPKLTITFVDRDSIGSMWKVRGAKSSANVATLVFGADLVRGVRYDGATAHLSGSVSDTRTLQVYVPAGITAVTWNGAALGAVANGVASGSAPGPKAVTLPALTFTKMAERPEAAAAFDDSSWLTLDKTTTLNPRQQPPSGVILDSNAYGAYEGNVWYRASYTAGTNTSSIVLRGNGGTGAPGNTNLNAAGGTAAIMQVWVNGTYVGSKPANGNNQTFSVPAGTVTTGQQTKVAVLVMNLGQNLDWSDDGLSRQNRGLFSASLGQTGAITWKIQGAQGMADPVDTARGLYNNGGLYGERAGWHLPGYPSSNWTSTNTLRSDAGVTWYRSSFTLDLPADQDVMVGLKVNSERFAARQDFSRVMLFVNGWNTGLYAGNVGPQTQFTIPTGFLNPKGANEVVAVVSAERDTMGPESLSLVLVGNQTGSVPWAQNAAPAMPKVTLTASSAATTVASGEKARVTGSAQLPALIAGTIGKLVVDWGDGTTTDATVGAGLDAQHAYASDGTYTPTVTYVDAVSGSTLASVTTAAITVGTPATPTHTVTLASAPVSPDGANGWYVSTPKVTMTSDGTPIEFQLDDAAWATYLVPVSVPDGVHTVRGRVGDGPVASSTFDVDTVAPSVVPSASGRVLTIQASDATSGIAGVSYQLAGGAWQPYNGAVTVPGTDAVQVNVRASDKAGNLSEDSVLINAEGVAPSVTIAATSVQAGGRVQLQVAGFAPNTRLTVTLHSTPVQVGTLTTDANGAGSATVTIPASTTPGAHRIVVDQADPAAQAAAPITVTAAPKPGTLPGTGGAAGIAAFILAALIGTGVLLIVSRRRRTT